MPNCFNRNMKSTGVQTKRFFFCTIDSFLFLHIVPNKSMEIYNKRNVIFHFSYLTVFLFIASKANSFYIEKRVVRLWFEQTCLLPRYIAFSVVKNCSSALCPFMMCNIRCGSKNISYLVNSPHTVFIHKDNNYFIVTWSAILPVHNHSFYLLFLFYIFFLKTYELCAFLPFFHLLSFCFSNGSTRKKQITHPRRRTILPDLVYNYNWDMVTWPSLLLLCTNVKVTLSILLLSCVFFFPLPFFLFFFDNSSFLHWFQLQIFNAYYNKCKSLKRFFFPVQNSPLQFSIINQYSLILSCCTFRTSIFK